MNIPPLSKKPRSILHAEYALWAWTAWTCLFGIYQAWAQIPELEKMMADQGQGLIEIAPGTILRAAIAGYLAIALITVFINYKIGKGKKWARNSLLIGFVFDAVFAASPPYSGISDFMTCIPNIGLQIYVLYLLYTSPGKEWFK